MAQFTITAYYLLGGGYSMLSDDHVRMDLFYGKLSKKGKAKMDIFTSFFLIFYLAILFFGSITSLIYTIETKQKLFTAWAPYVWPIKTLMLIGILLMLLQAFSSLFKSVVLVCVSWSLVFILFISGCSGFARFARFRVLSRIIYF